METQADRNLARRRFCSAGASHSRLGGSLALPANRNPTLLCGRVRLPPNPGSVLFEPTEAFDLRSYISDLRFQI